MVNQGPHRLATAFILISGIMEHEEDLFRKPISVKVTTNKDGKPNHTERVIKFSGPIKPQVTPTSENSRPDYIPGPDLLYDNPKPIQLQSTEENFIVIDTPTPEEKANLKADKFSVDIDTQITINLNPYSNVCSAIGFLIQSLHEHFKSLTPGTYNLIIRLKNSDAKK